MPIGRAPGYLRGVDLRLPAAALCFAAAALAAATVRGDAAPAARRSGDVGEVLGGLGAFAAQASWIRADVALRANREDEALLHMQAVAALEPQLVSVSRMMAFEIGASLAAGHADPAVRWNLVRTGLRILDRAAELNPRSSDAFAFRGTYLMSRVASDPLFDAEFRRTVDPAGPFAKARADHREAARLRSDDPLCHLQHAFAAGAHALELADGSRWDAAATAADETAEAYGRVLALMAAERADRPGTQGGETARQVRESRDAVLELAGICRGPADGREARFAEYRARLE